MLGAVESTTLMVCAPLAVPPQASLAVQVGVMPFVSAHSPGASVSAYVMSGLGSQLSVAVATPVALVEVEAVGATVRLIGQVITGAVLSVAVMVWLLVPDSLPQAS